MLLFPKLRWLNAWFSCRLRGGAACSGAACSGAVSRGLIIKGVVF